MSIFAHYVAHCAIAHQAAVRAARSPHSTAKEVSDLTIALIHKLHRLETLYRELGAAQVFGTPPSELTDAEIRALFPAAP